MTAIDEPEDIQFDRMLSDFITAEVARADRFASLQGMVERVGSRPIVNRRSMVDRRMIQAVAVLIAALALGALSVAPGSPLRRLMVATVASPSPTPSQAATSPTGSVPELPLPPCAEGPKDATIGTLPTPGPAAEGPVANGSIAIVRTLSDGSSEIDLLDPEDGSLVRPILAIPGTTDRVRGSGTGRVEAGGLAWSPDGGSLALGAGAGMLDKSVGPYGCSDLYVDSVETGTITRLTAEPIGAYAGTDSAWSPDGRLIAFVRRERHTDLPHFLYDDDVEVVDPSSEARLVFSMMGGITPPTVKWSASGDQLAEFTPEFNVFASVKTTSRGQCADLDGTRACAGAWGSLAWAPDRQAFAWIRPILTHLHSPTKALFVADASGSHRLATIASPFPGNSLAWSPDGSRLAVVGLTAPGSIHLVPLDGSASQALTLPDGMDAVDRLLGYSPDGTQLLITAASGDALVRLPVDGTAGVVLATDPGFRVETAAWQPLPVP